MAMAEEEFKQLKSDKESIIYELTTLKAENKHLITRNDKLSKIITDKEIEIERVNG